jgi:lipopolysaccharide/colanic/teichoic acid biosynthesis glycosyltransferase
VKRTCDILAAALGLTLLSPLFLLLGILVKLDSPGSVFFIQERMGERFRPFRLLKFRSMKQYSSGPQITSAGDHRVTRVGQVLRKYKMDELPQLWNILRGEMSIVGPRPEVPQFVTMFQCEYQKLLSVRPGLTSPASLKYRDESAILCNTADPVSYYTRVILPDKLSLDMEYVANWSFWRDLKLMAVTVFACVK